MRNVRAAVLLAGLVLPLCESSATMLRTYDLELTFSECLSGGVACAAGDPVTTGVAYHGSFSVDAAHLATDGFKNVGFDSFFLQLGSFVWDSQNPFPGSDYAGSRFFNPSDNSGGIGPWTLLVESGEVTGICCGVFGIGDVPFVDLFSWAPFGLPFEPNHVGVNAFEPGGFSFTAAGTFNIRQIPEPASLALVLVSLLSFGAIRIASRGAGRRGPADA
jgi:hypothetical protein